MYQRRWQSWQSAAKHHDVVRRTWVATPRSLSINTPRSRTALTGQMSEPATESEQLGSCDSLRLDEHHISSVLSALSWRRFELQADICVFKQKLLLLLISVDFDMSYRRWQWHHLLNSPVLSMSTKRSIAQYQCHATGKYIPILKYSCCSNRRCWTTHSCIHGLMSHTGSARVITSGHLPLCKLLSRSD